MAEAPKSREVMKDSFEGVAKGFKLVVEKIKKWWESGSKPEERDFSPVIDARDNMREEIRDQNERDEKPGRVFVASRENYGEAADMVGNPEVSLKVGDPILLQGKDGVIVDRVVNAEDVQKQELINRNRGYIGKEDVDLKQMTTDGYGDELQKRVLAFQDALAAREDFQKLPVEEQQNMYDRIQNTIARRAASVKATFSPDNIDNVLVEEIFSNNLSDEEKKKGIAGSLDDAGRKAFSERWEEDLRNQAASEVGSMTAEKEIGLQKMVMEDMRKQGKNPTREEVIDILNAGGGAGRVEALAELKKREEKKRVEESVFVRTQGEIKALDKLLEEIKNVPSFDKEGVLDGIVGTLIQKSQVDALIAGKDIEMAREARRNGFDRVSIKPADVDVVVPPIGPVEPPIDVIVDPPPPPIGPDGPGPDGPIGPIGPETPPVAPPIGPRGPEGVSPERLGELRTNMETARDAYLLARSLDRTAGLNKIEVDKQRAQFERSRELYIGAEMSQYAEAGRRALAEKDAKIAELRKQFEAAGGPAVKEGENPTVDALRAGLSALLNERAEMVRSQKEALTQIGLKIHSELEQGFFEAERTKEPTGWYAKMNRFWMSKAGSAVKVVGGVGLTTVGGFTGLLPLVGLGTTMAASGIGWEAGKAWGRNKLQTSEQISRLSPLQVEQTLHSQRELVRRQGRVDPERVATIQALEARSNQLREEDIRNRVLERGVSSPADVARIATEELGARNYEYLGRAEATDERARKWEIRRRKIAGIAGGIGVGLASLAAHFGQAAGNLASEAATRTAMKANYDGNDWHWVRNNGREFWDGVKQVWHTTGGTGGFPGAKEIIVTLPK